MDDSLFTVDLEPNVRSVNGSTRSDSFLLNAYIGDQTAVLVRVALEHLLSGHAACSPLVFCGPAGTGKTLLSRLAMQRLQTAVIPREVLWYSGAGLSRTCGLAAETNSMAELRRRLQQAGALVIDDLHQIAGKPLAEEEVRHAIDQSARRRRWVIATCSQPPAAVARLSADLISRLSGGLVVPLSMPGLQAKREILRRMALRHGLELDPAVIDFLAELESVKPAGAAAAVSVAQLNQWLEHLKDAEDDRPITLERVREALGATWNASQPDLRSISTAVARYFDQKPDDLRGPARRKELVQARGIAMYLARQLTDKSLWQVGKHFGNRDHTTVLHACRRTQKLMQQDAAVRKAVEDLVSQFACTSG